jgi:hypothetical protein
LAGSACGEASGQLILVSIAFILLFWNEAGRSAHKTLEGGGAVVSWQRTRLTRTRANSCT